MSLQGQILMFSALESYEGFAVSSTLHIQTEGYPSSGEAMNKANFQQNFDYQNSSTINLIKEARRILIITTTTSSLPYIHILVAIPMYFGCLT